MSEGKSLVSAGLAGAMDLSRLGAYLEMAISDRSGAFLRVPFANLPQESSDISAVNVEQILDLEAEIRANVGSPPASQTWKWEPTLISELPLA